MFIENYKCKSVVKSGILNSVNCEQESTFKVSSRGDNGVQAEVDQSLSFAGENAAKGSVEPLDSKLLIIISFHIGVLFKKMLSLVTKELHHQALYTIMNNTHNQNLLMMLQNLLTVFVKAQQMVFCQHNTQEISVQQLMSLNQNQKLIYLKQLLMPKQNAIWDSKYFNLIIFFKSYRTRCFNNLFF